MRRWLVILSLVPLPVLAQVVVTTAPPTVHVYDANHKAIGERLGRDLVQRPVTGTADDFGMLTIQTPTGPVLVRDTSVTTSGTLPPPKAASCVNLAPAARSAQVNSVNGLSSRCKDGQ